jgi:hypothetical protein
MNNHPERAVVARTMSTRDMQEIGIPGVWIDSAFRIALRMQAKAAQQRIALAALHLEKFNKQFDDDLKKYYGFECHLQRKKK